MHLQDDSSGLEDDLDIVVADEAFLRQPTKPSRRASIKKNLGRAGSKVSNAVLAALRSNADDSPVALKADRTMAGWQSFLSEREQEESAMEGAFKRFQDMVEQAMNLKYEELRGDGDFLFNEEAVATTTEEAVELPAELSVEKGLPTTPNDEEMMWIAHTENEEYGRKNRVPYTGSFVRSCLPSDTPRTEAADLRHYSPKLQTCPAGPPNSTRVTRSEESMPVMEARCEPIRSTKIEAQPDIQRWPVGVSR